MVEKIVCQVVAYVAKDAPRENANRNIPVPKEDSMSELIERSG